MDPEYRPLQRRTVLKTIGVGAVSSVTLSGAVAAHSGGVSRELAEVRSATAEYNNPANAEADGYEGEDQAVCGMGYHYVNFDLVMDGRPEKLRPEGMVYGETSNGNRILGAVEYIVPKAAPYETEPPSGLFDYADPEWDILDLGNPAIPLLWTLHAWVHTHSPDGVFHHTNPRKQFYSEGCRSH
jgi:hypothetical protein